MKPKHLILSLLALLTSVKGSAYDAYINGIYYSFSGTYATVVNDGGSGGSYSGKVCIPESVNYNGTTYSVKIIGQKAFINCTQLTAISIPNSVKTIQPEAFTNTGLTSVIIPEGVTNIFRAAFTYCFNLKSVFIPKSVTYIGELAFANNTPLDSVIVKWDSPSELTTLTSNAFPNRTTTSKLYVPVGTIDAYQGDTFWKGFSMIVEKNFAEGITLNTTNLSFNAVNNTELLSTTITPSNTTDKSVTWKSSNTSVATVSNSGVVTAKGNGTATITARTNDGTNLTATCTVTVNIPILATGITLNQSTLSFTAANQTATLAATVTPSNAANKNVTWTSSNTNVATVSSTGVVTAKANGTTTITAKTADGTNLTAQCTVTVDIKATDITLNQSALSFTAANQTATLIATVTPSTAANKNVTWTSSNTNVATVDNNGLVTAVAAGSATITATTNDGTNLSASCEVNVSIAAPAEPDTDIAALDNVIYINKVEAGAGQEFDLSIKMKNTAAIRGYQFDLYLPDGMSVVEDEDGYPLVNLSTERTRMGRHTVEGIIQSDGALRVLSGAQRDYTYSGNDGEVCTITVHISDEMAEGDYPIIFRNIKLTETDISQTYNTSYLKATLSVSTYTLGDINGDGAIDVADYIGVANAILGMPPTSYVEKAADVNVDGIVDVADYIGVANLILYGNVYGSNGNQVKAFVLTPEDIFVGSVIRK